MRSGAFTIGPNKKEALRPLGYFLSAKPMLSMYGIKLSIAYASSPVIRPAMVREIAIAREARAFFIGEI